MTSEHAVRSSSAAAVNGFLRMARDLFRRKATMQATWQNPALEADCEALEKLSAVIAEHESAWEALEKRVDFDADLRRERLRSQLPPLFAKRSAIERRIVQGAEVEKIVNEVLRPLYAQKLDSLQRCYAEFTANAAVPADADFLAFSADCHELNTLAAALFEATGLAEYRRPFDGVGKLRSHWFDINKARERLRHLTGPGNKPRLGQTAWLPAAHRLAALRASTTPPQEIVNA